MKPDKLLDIQAELGEAPLWDPVSQRLYMIDIIRCRLIAYDWSTGGTQEWPLPALGGGLARCRDGRLLVAAQTGIFYFDPSDGSYEFVVNPDASMPINRLNEGKCDPHGRFWIGSICTLDRRPTGGLFRIGVDGVAIRMLSDIYVPNCLVWSLNRDRVFFADSHRKTIWTFAYDAESGALSDRRVHLDLTGNVGIPDGGTIDNEGCLWNAEFGGGRVRRYSVDGAVLAEVVLPVSQVTSCTFAGPDLDHLVIVTAKRLLTPQQRLDQPEAGDVFVVRPGNTGLAEPVFAGTASMGGGYGL